MASQNASELKQQGALEAAQNPESSVTAEAAEHVAVDEAKKAGSAALQFDPNASVEEKRAQARAVRPLPLPVHGTAPSNALADHRHDSASPPTSTMCASPMRPSLRPTL